MIDRDASSSLRLQFAAAVLGFAASGGLSAWLGIAALARILSRSGAHAPLVEFRPLYVIGLPLAVAFFALTVLALLPREAASRQRGRQRLRAPHLIFGVVVGSLLLATITASLARFSMAEMMRSRGYKACAATDTERRPPMRWVRDGGRCP